MSSARKWTALSIAASATRVKSSGYVGLKSREEFNAAGKHVGELIKASFVLFRGGHFGPSVFLTITSFEEIAKIRWGHTRSRDPEINEVKRGKDPLFRHSDKHKISVDPLLLSSGSRLFESIGQKRVEEIFEKYENGEYSSFRETSLYFSRDESGLKLPSEEITEVLAAEHLLIAIEMFYDFFDFMTAEVSEVGDELNSLYPEVERSI